MTRDAAILARRAALCLWVLAARGASGSVLSVPDTVVVAPGETVSVAVAADAVAGVYGYCFTLSWSDQFAFAGAAPGSLTGSWGQQAAFPEAGRVTVAASGAVAAEGSGSLAVVSLRALNTAPDALEDRDGDGCRSISRITMGTGSRTYSRTMTGMRTCGPPRHRATTRRRPRGSR